MATPLQMAIQRQQEKLLACVHCGLCLPHCPTYGVLGDENDSPRGRLYLMRAVAESRLAAGPAYARHLEACIGCRACESACPSGVEFGHLMEAARHDLRRARLDDLGAAGRLARWVGVNVVIDRRWLLKPAVWPMRIVRRLRPRRGWPRRLPRLLRQGLEMLPDPAPRRPAPGRVPPVGVERVVQFRGCIMDELYGDVNEATTRVLVANGCRVDMPGRQGCCGALHAHAGYLDEARRLARKNIDALDDGSDAPIIVNAAGCGAMLKEYGQLLADDPAYAERASRLSARVRDVTEFLAGHAIVAGAALPYRLTYDAPCHLHHAQRVQLAPMKVLATIPGLTFVPLAGAERCCGSGGIYNLTHAAIANDVLAEKLDAIRQTRADVLVTANPGCQMQIQAGARLAGIPIRVAHIVELLDESYAAAGLYDGRKRNGRTTSQGERRPPS